ncbi:hypothetical protein RLIN73S_02390 [Rhodanobacter lindaniclasticus]
MGNGYMHVPSPRVPPMRILPAALADLDTLVPLFDGYRQFYGQPTDLARARAFLAERIERGESLILLARGEERRGPGLHPAVSAVLVGARGTHLAAQRLVRGGIGASARCGRGAVDSRGGVGARTRCGEPVVVHGAGQCAGAGLVRVAGLATRVGVLRVQPGLVRLNAHRSPWSARTPPRASRWSRRPRRPDSRRARCRCCHRRAGTRGRRAGSRSSLRWMHPAPA